MRPWKLPKIRFWPILWNGLISKNGGLWTENMEWLNLIWLFVAYYLYIKLTRWIVFDDIFWAYQAVMRPWKLPKISFWPLLATLACVTNVNNQIAISLGEEDIFWHLFEVSDHFQSLYISPSYNKYIMHMLLFAIIVTGSRYWVENWFVGRTCLSP